MYNKHVYSTETDQCDSLYLFYLTTTVMVMSSPSETADVQHC